MRVMGQMGHRDIFDHDWHDFRARFPPAAFRLVVVHVQLMSDPQVLLVVFSVLLLHPAIQPPHDLSPLRIAADRRFRPSPRSQTVLLAHLLALLSLVAGRTSLRQSGSSDSLRSRECLT